MVTFSKFTGTKPLTENRRLNCIAIFICFIINGKLLNTQIDYRKQLLSDVIWSRMVKNDFLPCLRCMARMIGDFEAFFGRTLTTRTLQSYLNVFF